MDMVNRVGEYIRTHSLINDGETVTVALSGGADSVCLLRILKRLGHRVGAAHCNFHLRGSESDRDEAFVRNLCANLDVPLQVRHFDTRAEARRTGRSIEMVARDQRYAWFATLGTTVAVAHHKCDNAETLLLNLLRGTGLAGLVGMPPMRVLDSGLRVIRPLLCVTRQEIEAFVGSGYVTDSTNLDDDAMRNIIRHHLASMSREMNRDLVAAINKSAACLADSHNLYEKSLRESIHSCFDGTRIGKSALLDTPAPATVLHEILAPYGFKHEQTADILNERDGNPGRIYESAQWRLLRDRECWLLRAKGERYDILCPTLPLEGDVRVTKDVTLRITRHTYTGYVIPRESRFVSLDLEKLQFPITVRLTSPGDRFVPLGMSGSRLVSDYLTDRHRSVFEKERQLVILSGSEIAWLVDERPSALFALTDKTRFVVRIEVV